MCGISGYIGKQEAEEMIAAMVATQQHRGPDATGSFIDKGFAALGHNRLSIIDLSAEANQPFTDTSGRYVMVYNGEVYNYRELRESLSNEYHFNTQSDTEVVLVAYLKFGANCLSHFNGMFAFAVWGAGLKNTEQALDKINTSLYSNWFEYKELQTILNSNQSLNRVPSFHLWQWMNFSYLVSKLVGNGE